MKLISWNVNGLRACCDKGFREIFNELDADFFCLQETKMQEGQLDLAFRRLYFLLELCRKKGYSGTAIFTRHQPLSVTYGLGIDEHDHEATGHYTGNGKLLSGYGVYPQLTGRIETSGLPYDLGGRFP